MRVTGSLLVVLAMWPGAAALARDLPPDLRPLIEEFQAHRRVAVGYLRTQNGDLGAVEIERLRDRWVADRHALSAATAADAALSAAMARTEALVAGSLTAIDAGNIERAWTLLDSAAKPLDAWRKANGIRLFSDCISEIVAAYDRLDPDRLTTPDLADAGIGARIAADAGNVAAALDRCDREAAEPMRQDPAFRRLFDGMRASLRQMPDAIASRDGALLHRLLIEQRSFEELLSFRYG
jgi:hypothetical protein